MQHGHASQIRHENGAVFTEKQLGIMQRVAEVGRGGLEEGGDHGEQRKRRGLHHRRALERVESAMLHFKGVCV